MNSDIRNIAAQVSKATDWQDFIQDIPDTALQQAGLVDPGYSSSSIDLRELTGITLLRIHSLQPFAVLKDSMAACDIQLPAKVNQSLGLDPAAMCLAPGEWLLFSEYLSYSRLFAQLQGAVKTHHTVALDLSDGLAVFRLSGSGSPWLLNKLSGLDFQSGIATPAHCARTRLQQVAVTLHYHQPGGFASDSVFDLIFDRSIARCLWQLLIASVPHAEELAQQFGIEP